MCFSFPRARKIISIGKLRTGKLYGGSIRLSKTFNAVLFDGIGKPEPLKGNYQGWWSRRIDEINRIVYKAEAKQIVIAQCKTHYDG